MIQNCTAMDTQQRDFLNLVKLKLDNQEFDEAFQLAQTRFPEDGEVYDKFGVLFTSQLACLLCDIGAEGCIIDALYLGLSYITIYSSKLKNLVSKSSLEYTLGNAKLNIFQVFLRQEGNPISPESAYLLTEAKNHFWKAYLNSELMPQHFLCQILVNLGNALSISGRIVEAFQWYDSVVSKYPKFGMAHLNRAKLFTWLYDLSSASSQTMLVQGRNGFKSAIESQNVPTVFKDRIKGELGFLVQKLKEAGITDDKLQKYHKTIYKQADEQTQYRKFCLENCLTLNEHAIYCPCVSAEKDNLCIPLPEPVLIGKYIPKMELIMNRIKSEFAVYPFDKPHLLTAAPRCYPYL